MNTDEVLILLALVVGIPFAIACAVMFFVTWWKIFEKGGENGWAIFVPFYNAYILGKVAGGVNFGIWVLIVAIMNFFASIILIIVGVLDGNLTDSITTIIFIVAYCFAVLPLWIIRFIIAFKLGGKFGCDVWFKVLLTIPYLDAFPHLYLALSKNCVYREKPKEASVGLFVLTIILMSLIMILILVLVSAVG